MRDVLNAGALDLIEATVAAGATPAAARKWWMGELARAAKQREVDLADLPVTPAQVGELQALVDAGRINDKLARQVLEGVLAGEGGPEEVLVARGLGVVSDDGALLAAIDDVLAAQPDVADRIRGGRLQAVGAIVGGVMKATRGQADAARVRELVLSRLGVEG
jgi:aspartyl-tRNA(Asn)/glutamyl-tRNA(Gln) amidotransferase subunit B